MDYTARLRELGRNTVVCNKNCVEYTKIFEKAFFPLKIRIKEFPQSYMKYRSVAVGGGGSLKLVLIL